MAFDLQYEIDSDIPPRELWERDRDSVYYFDTVVRRVIETALAGARGRLLDVGSGDGSQIRAFAANANVQAYGLEMSGVLIGRARESFERDGIAAGLARGAAERLPFADGTFDRIVCQGSLDHFADPRAFLRECARVLAPNGRLVIALQNFDSASCRISRAAYRLRGVLGMRRDDPTGGERPYWRIPHNHTFKGNPRTLQEMCSAAGLRPVRVYGVSMFWLLPMWRRLLRILPAPAASFALRGADRLAYRAPTAADMVIGAWRKR